MSREKLNRQLRQIQDEILLLGSMVEQAVIKAVDALKNRNAELARQVWQDDQIINEKRYAIENAIITLIATQAPVAHDLRLMAAFLEVITDLERMGDYAKGIAKVTIRIGDTSLSIPMRDFERMTEMSIDMLHRAISAFIAEDPNQASLIPAEDVKVDELYNQIYHSIVHSMMDHPESIDQANLLLWVAHNLERLADRVTNICERTVFSASGEVLEFDVSDDEDFEA